MSDQARPTVLIVDDDRMNRVALAELLQEACRILMAKDGLSALQILSRERVDLVLLDVSMPGMDGYEVLRQAKANPETADVTVIFITGHTEEAEEERGLKLGASDYVQKPFRPAVVHARVMLHLKLAQQRRELERLALQDSLTGIANRRHFDMRLEQALRHAARGGKGIGLALFDIDFFRQYNELHGHDAGDEILRQIGRLLPEAACYPGEVVARYGGEEFAVLLSEVEGFQDRLEQIRTGLLARRIPHGRSSVSNFVTLSGGAVRLTSGGVSSRRALLQWGEQLLLRAKQAGRNRLVVEETMARVPRPPETRPPEIGRAP